MKENYSFDGWIRGNKSSIQSYLSSCDIDEQIELTGSTIVKQLETTEKDQYRVSRSILLDSNFRVKSLKSIFLMQRSSSIILGAESGWRAESNSLATLLSAINKCENFYHLITLEGIESHLKREQLLP